MSSLGVANRATSTAVSVSHGYVVKIRVPSDARMGNYPEGMERMTYLQFAHNFPGGVVNFFVHTNEDLRGSIITANVAVMMKTLADGRSFLYIDLVPCDLVPTHRLSVVPMGTGSWTNSDWDVFQTPEPYYALIVLSPPDAKIVEHERDPRAQSRLRLVKTREHLHAPTVPLKSADPQLDRLLADGWSVTSENDRFAYLERQTAGGVTKTMTHCRPRKK